MYKLKLIFSKTWIFMGSR